MAVSGRWNRIRRLPEAQGADLGIERHELAERRRARAGKADDEQRTFDLLVVDGRVPAVDVLDPEPVSQEHAQAHAEDLLAERRQAGLGPGRLDQAVEALAVAIVTEVLQAGLGDGCLDQSGGVEHQTKSEPPSTLMLAPVT